MERAATIDVAIVDYGLGNLFSVARACERVGLRVSITSDRRRILAAPCVVLPGVGAFGDAMENLHRLDLVSPLREVAASQRTLIGICLGMQLLMSESEEFGSHPGLGIIEGSVTHFGTPEGPRGKLKVPQVGWNRIYQPRPSAWNATYLEALQDGTYMYFVHSYYARPADSAVVLSKTTYGDVTFCSSVKRDNIVAFQFHPERSAAQGACVYQSIAKTLHRENSCGGQRDAA